MTTYSRQPCHSHLKRTAERMSGYSPGGRCRTCFTASKSRTTWPTWFSTRPVSETIGIVVTGTQGSPAVLQFISPHQFSSCPVYSCLDNVSASSISPHQFSLCPVYSCLDNVISPHQFSSCPVNSG